MISYFFIDRPIFASVLSIVITLAGGIAVFYLPIAQYPQITPPAVTVSINYPGASAQVVADTVAAPIEQQVNGVEGMLYMSSQMGNDGSYTLTVTFDIGTDLNTALVMVQNRVALAMPQLPNSVQNQGITVRKRTPDILMVANLFSPDHRYNDIYLSNFAMIYLRDELLRLDGVSDVNIFGERDYSIRVWLDPQKMAACNMTSIDVAAAIRSQNKEAVPGQIGQPPIAMTQSFQAPIDTLGRLADPEQFGNIIVKVGPLSPVQQFLGTAGAFQNISVPVPQIVSPIQSSGLTGNSLTNSGLGGALSGGMPSGLGGGGSPGGGSMGGNTANFGLANTAAIGGSSFDRDAQLQRDQRNYRRRNYRRRRHEQRRRNHRRRSDHGRRRNHRRRSNKRRYIGCRQRKRRNNQRPDERCVDQQSDEQRGERRRDRDRAARSVGRHRAPARRGPHRDGRGRITTSPALLTGIHRSGWPFASFPGPMRLTWVKRSSQR